MAVAATTITGVKDTVFGNERVHTRRLTFSSNYATGGEAITASDFGLRSFTRPPVFHGAVAMASALTSGNAVSWDHTNSKIVFFESAATGLALLEKTSAEAYPTGAFIDVTAHGV